MKLGRRGFLGAIGMSPVVGPEMAKQALSGLSDMAATPGVPPQFYGEAAQAVRDTANHIADDPVLKQLQGVYKQAEHYALRDPLLRELVAEKIRQNMGPPGSIDPDIMVLKAVSPMMKVVYQRQRNVERGVDYFINSRKDPTYHEDEHHVLRKYMSVIMHKVFGIDMATINKYWGY